MLSLSLKKALFRNAWLAPGLRARHSAFGLFVLDCSLVSFIAPALNRELPNRGTSDRQTLETLAVCVCVCVCVCVACSYV